MRLGAVGRIRIHPLGREVSYRIGIYDSLTYGVVGVPRRCAGLGYAGRCFKRCVGPLWGGSCWFYPGTGMFVGKAEAGAAVLCISSVRQDATRLGVSSAGICNYCRHHLPFYKIK